MGTTKILHSFDFASYSTKNVFSFSQLTKYESDFPINLFYFNI